MEVKDRNRCPRFLRLRVQSWQGRDCSAGGRQKKTKQELKCWLRTREDKAGTEMLVGGQRKPGRFLNDGQGPERQGRNQNAGQELRQTTNGLESWL